MLIKLVADDHNEIVTADSQSLQIPDAKLRAVGNPFIVSTYSASHKEEAALREAVEGVVRGGDSEIRCANAYRLGRVDSRLGAAMNGFHYAAPVQLYTIDSDWLDFRYIREEDRVPTDILAMHPLDKV